MHYGSCGKIIAKQGEGDALARHLLDAAAVLEDVDGCHLYVVARQRDNPDALWVTEAWESPEAHRASLELEAIQRIIAGARPIIGEMTERIELDVAGGVGVPDAG